jgi:hypothetical protein
LIIGIITLIVLTYLDGNSSRISAASIAFFAIGGILAGLLVGAVFGRIIGGGRLSYALKIGGIFFIAPLAIFLPAFFSEHSMMALKYLAYALIIPIPAFLIGALIGRIIDKRHAPSQIIEARALARPVGNAVTRFFNYFLK